MKLYICKNILLTLCLVFSLLPFIHALDEISLKFRQTSLSCKRNVQYSTPANQVTFTSGTTCDFNVTTKASLSTFTGLKFEASVATLPMIKMAASAGFKIQLGNKLAPLTINIDTGVAFGFDSIFEYLDNDGTPGYQPNTADSIVKEYSLVGLSWKVISVTKTDLTSDGSAAVYKAVSSVDIPNFCTVTFTGFITTNEVSFESKTLVSRTVTQVLVPSSFKSSLEITGIKYSNANSKLGISTLVAFRGAIFEKPRARNILAEERPDTATSDQKVIQFNQTSFFSSWNLPDGFELPNPYLSFQTFVSKYSTLSAGITKSQLVTTALKSDFSLNAATSALKKDLTFASVVRFYASLTERVDNLNWDPSLGAEDKSASGTVSSASSVKIGSIVVIAVLALFGILL
ncbi:hypothetical protein NAEGRDRAFT_80050 [Naegleria gruberi]|uniref:Uncharacterized protein n=1 Tax=Naegleria gruberi TaxID=5762 RepID=D2VI51_NAEGR|nr:uncharacterized protein NAEGRDRAFT_80050 [Naegleria gruberi]EFC43529.1 hypothetical protein NAEGRDRAFT_80050 [Naegleria gruberi]|eukprot:XP_002676273.1 hypothetical protein NAEGRDRAFT_80050 [Naegleria gruberi strain NEG-M]